ncbi:MAG TPA: T9SS type A sorting domain-containing protein [Chitinophagales bacterium]|nr:T9SS type A sorting domain-containing protein [Chitinophagales bacterium]HQW80198.1 T9SS type A sorting domain-containing protein [Chitinophagales bacterium]
MKFLSSFVFTFILSNSSFAQCENGRYLNKIFSQTTRTQNITYHRALNAAGVLQNVLMDVFEPQDDTALLRPLVIFQHGGAYWTGTKDYESQIAMGNEFAKRGYVVASATYRLESSPLSLLFQDLMLKAVGRGVQDTKALVYYFFQSARNNSNPYNIDTNRIFLCGASAGAFNVLHTVYLDSLDNLNTDWKNWLNQIGGVFGAYDFIDFGEKILGVVNINGALGDKNFLNNEHTNFLSVHNLWDPEIPFNRGQPYNIPTMMFVDGSNILHSKAQELNIYNPFYVIPDWGHTSYSTDLFGTVVQPYFDSTVWYMKNFFAYQLGCSEITTGIKNNSIKTISFYPNPTMDEFYFNHTQSYIGNTIVVSDIIGNEIYNAPFSGEAISSKSIGLTKGIYIVHIYNALNKETSSGKIIID